MRKEGRWNASRVFAALGRIGYTPVSALLDITDNSLSWGATRIAVNIQKHQAVPSGGLRRRAVISSFSVVDNGIGMDESGLDNALTLGAGIDSYTPSTLSKFGLGLKSAAFSLGGKLEVISRHKDDPTVRKVTTSFEMVAAAAGDFVYDLLEPSEEDMAELQAHCGAGSGTLVRITSIHINSMPSVSDIVDGLRQRAGITYYYYLAGMVKGMEKLELSIDGQTIDPVDPLFIASVSADLDEKNWDGTSVRWITRPRTVQLDVSGEPTAQVEIVQLPHPPSVEAASSERTARKETRQEYLIEAGNYGFYVYRNYRLIRWADSLGGMVPHDKRLYGFRGRLLIGSDSDDLLNIDVSKSHIQLSEIAVNQLTPEATEAVKKSRAAWDQRTRALQEAVGDTPHAEINEALDKIATTVEHDDKIDEEVAPPAEKDSLQSRRQRAMASKPAKPDETQKLKEGGERVQFVDYLDNNQLWERAHDPQSGLIVKINKSHRFYRDILINMLDNADLIKVIDVLFFGLARGEFDLIYKGDHNEQVAEKVMQDYREHVGTQMSEIVRRIIAAKVIDE